MAFSTVYDVKIRYSMDNRATRGVAGLKNETRALGKEVGAVTGMLTRMGAGVAGFFGLRMAGKALVGFNSTVEDTKLQISGMLSLAKKTDLADQISTADRLYARLQKRASTLPGTTQEYVNMAGKLTRVIVDAGGSVKDLEDITVNAVVAAKGLGEHWEVAARDIEQGLMGRYNTTDPFLSKILPSIGYKGEEGRDKWRALSEEKRLAEMKRGILQKQFTQMGDAQGQTFSGATSTLKDTLEQFIGKVGLPLFQAITKEVKEWNKWIASNGDRVESIAKSLGSGLVKGFTMIKDALGLVVKHADTLIMIGKVWAAVKLAGMAGGFGLRGAAAAGAAGGGIAGWARGARDGYDKDGNYQYQSAGRGRQGIGGMRGVAENAGLIIGAGLGGYELGKMLGLDKFGEDIGRSAAIITGRMSAHELALERTTRATRFFEAAIRRAGEATDPNTSPNLVTKRGTADALIEQSDAAKDYLRYEQEGADWLTMAKAKARLAKAGIEHEDVTPEMVTNLEARSQDTRAAGYLAASAGEVIMQASMLQLTDYQRQTLDLETARNRVFDEMYTAFRNGIPIKPESILDILKGASGDPEGKHKSLADKPKVNVTIQRIEVQSDDPDRMAFGLIESFRDAAKNPSSALAAIREG